MLPSPVCVPLQSDFGSSLSVWVESGQGIMLGPIVT